MEWYIVLAVIGAGIISGFLNTLAGSGSFITVPLLMYAGLPANIANGTNRIAILLQSIVGVSFFKKNKVIDFRSDLWLSTPIIAGSIVGALLAVYISNAIFEKVFGIILVIMFFLFLLKPDIWIKSKAKQTKPKNKKLQILFFFAIGIYGGFIQAGVGLFMLAGLIMACGYDLLKANALKLLFVLVYTPFALAIFIYDGQINYLWGFYLSIGNMLGAYIASHMALKKGAEFIRIFVLIAILLAALQLTGVIGWLLP